MDDSELRDKCKNQLMGLTSQDRAVVEQAAGILSHCDPRITIGMIEDVLALSVIDDVTVLFIGAFDEEKKERLRAKMR